MPPAATAAGAATRPRGRALTMPGTCYHALDASNKEAGPACEGAQAPAGEASLAGHGRAGAARAALPLGARALVRRPVSGENLRLSKAAGIRRQEREMSGSVHIPPPIAALAPSAETAAVEAAAGTAAAGASLLLTPEEQAVRALAGPGGFDPGYYLLTNQDVCDAGIEPLDHFVRSGRHEGRRPAHPFDPQYYRTAYPDVNRSGQDPFLHYLLVGRAEGRAALRRNGAARQTLAAARPPGERRPAAAQDIILHLRPQALLDGLRAGLAGMRGLVVSAVRDGRTHGAGSTGALIAGEQAAFNAQGEAYLHLAPSVPLQTLAPETPAPDGPVPRYLDLALNGTFLGASTGDELAGALRALAPELPEARQLVVHSLLGHDPAELAALHAALHAGQAGPSGTAPGTLPGAVFWVHHYETICIGFRLLRNDVEFCGAPPIGSGACRICVYGEARAAHLAAVRRLFEAVPFHVAAPSEAALQLWLRKAGLPHRSARVVEPLRVDAAAVRRQPGGAERGSAANPVRIAFLGHPAPHRGWNAFREIAAEFERSGRYRLLHVSPSGDTGLKGVEHRTAGDGPGAMAAALTAAGVDLALILPPWPETASAAASAALAAGADVLTLACSGHAARLVERTGRGQVFAAVDDVAAFLASPAAGAHVRARLAAGADAGRVSVLGGAADLPALEDAPASRMPPELAGGPAGRFAGGPSGSGEAA